MKANATQILQKLYDSEINFEIKCFWDNGFTVKLSLGDDMNGYKGFYFTDKFAEGLDILAKQAALNYPESEFAEWWNINKGYEFNKQKGCECNCHEQLDTDNQLSCPCGCNNV